MILRSTYLIRKPAIFQAMTGLSVALFEDLVWDLRPALAQRREPHLGIPAGTRRVVQADRRLVPGKIDLAERDQHVGA